MKVYIAGPLTGDPVTMEKNVQAAMRAGCELMMLGYQAFVPHSSYFMVEFAKKFHLYVPTWEDWITLDLAMLNTFDALIRLPGLSNGADLEVARAKELKIPVFYSIKDFLDWARSD